VTAITDGLSDSNLPVRPDEPRDEFEIDLTPIWPADDERLEPIILAGLLWFEPEEFDPAPVLGASQAPLPAEFEEFLELDPQRGAQEPDEPPPPPRQRASATSLFGSLGVHLLPLLVLIGWSSAPAELSSTIPVQFVVEESSAARAEAPPDRPVTETISETRSNSDNAADTAPPAPPAVRPPPVKTASVKPPPKPSPPPEPTPRKPVAAIPPAPASPPEPTLRKSVAATAPAPATPAPAATPPGPASPAPAARPPATPPNPAPREARAPGPDPARGDYFDRLVALTRTHLDLLPSAFLAGRRGQTVLSIVVIADGTIGRISLKRSSGYPDVDTRIEQIVAAVGRFPPLPASFGGTPSIELDFDLTFPNAIQQ
jgi:TonB family protein